jgi:iron complex outermembrane receptor protein
MATSGYDFQLEYAIDAGPGRLRVHGLATHVDSATFLPAPGIPATEYAGKATGYIVTSSSAVFSLVPRWKGVIDLGYTTGGFFSNLRWRYIGSLVDAYFEEFKLPSRQYLDLTLGYEFDSGGLNGLSLIAGVTNLADEQPVIYPSSVEANTAPSLYDVLGRRYFLRAKYVF